MNTLTNKKHVHFIGIGGIGISAIARLLLASGVVVSGSDRSKSDITASLEKAGARIYIGQSGKNLSPDCDLIIYTVAVPKDNPEFLAASQRGVPMLSYPQTLEIVSREKYTIAIAGTHGKTTTTAMVGSILISAGLDPTVLVGGLMTDPRELKAGNALPEGTNFILGASRYFVVEADEYKKSFHNLFPKILVITNIDADHLDFYKDLADIQTAFRELAARVPADGFIVCNSSDPHVIPVITHSTISAKIIDYSTYSENLPPLRVPGAHNRQNAAAAAAAAKVLGIDAPAVATALQHFPGTWRRFQYKGETPGGVLVFDDYAHNPKKVAAAIAGAREAYPKHQIIVAFQPHLYSRTKDFFQEFTAALATADLVVLLPIYAAREQFDSTISSDMLAAAINRSARRATISASTEGKPVASVYPDFSAAKDFLNKTSLQKESLIIVMGAGDITALSDMLVTD